MMFFQRIICCRLVLKLFTDAAVLRHFDASDVGGTLKATVIEKVRLLKWGCDWLWRISFGAEWRDQTFVLWHSYKSFRGWWIGERRYISSYWGMLFGFPQAKARRIIRTENRGTDLMVLVPLRSMARMDYKLTRLGRTQTTVRYERLRRATICGCGTDVSRIMGPVDSVTYTQRSLALIRKALAQILLCVQTSFAEHLRTSNAWVRTMTRWLIVGIKRLRMVGQLRLTAHRPISQALTALANREQFYQQQLRIVRPSTN